MRPRVLAGVLVVVGCPAGRAADPDKVEIELSALADDVKKALDRQDQREVRIGRFTGDGDVPSNFGPEIQRILLAEFEKRKVAVSKDALIEVKGDYGPAHEDPAAPDSREMFIRVNATLVNTKTRQALAGFPVLSRAVYGNETLARAFAVPVAPPAGADRAARNDEIRKRIEQPETHAANAKVSARAGSPFAVEVLVVPDARAADPPAGRPAAVRDGLAFVEVRKTECYRVKVYNDAPFDVAVRLSVDGLDQFAFSDPEFRDRDGRPQFHYMVVRRRSAAVIRGWFRNPKQADAFLVTEYARSAAAELTAAPADVGQICVQFHAAWATDADKPKDETGKDAATGRGEKVDTNLAPVRREVGAMREQVAVRYSKN